MRGSLCDKTLGLVEISIAEKWLEIHSNVTTKETSPKIYYE